MIFHFKQSAIFQITWIYNAEQSVLHHWSQFTEQEWPKAPTFFFVSLISYCLKLSLLNPQFYQQFQHEKS